MNATVAIVVTIAAIAIIVILLVFQDAKPVAFLLSAIGWLWLGVFVLMVMLLLVGGVVGGIIMMVQAVQANNIGLGV